MSDAVSHGFPPRGNAWKSRDVLRAAAIVFGLYFTLRLLWFANALVLVAFLGVLFGLAISAGVDQLARVRVPRALGAATIVLAFFAVLYGAGALIAPTVSDQLAVLKSRLPEAQARVEGWLAQRGGLMRAAMGSGPAADTGRAVVPRGQLGGPLAPVGRGAAEATQRDTVGPGTPSPLVQGIGRQLQSATRYLFPFLTSTLAALAGAVVMLFLAIYVAVDPSLYRRGFLVLVPPESRDVASRVLSEMAVKLRKWLVTQLIAMLVIGVVSTIVLLILRVKAPFALGLLAGLLEFVPTIGPLLSAIPAIAMGFLDSPEKALSVTIAYIAIQQTEGQILIPMLMKGGIDLPPVLTILAQAVMAMLFGFLGLMVAVPLLAAVMVPLRILYTDREGPLTEAQLEASG
ncbi:MAG TPA: AI-2E family transporter [Gemmatimonadaceae bacterium]|nr:AI-2E family transporter [Gemmatimonadaceae bacterium]